MPVSKEITIAIYGRSYPRDDWRYEIDRPQLECFVADLASEYAPFGIYLGCRWEEETTLEVRGYADLLNTVRLRCPQEGFANLCLGHVIGVSQNRDLHEDIRRGVSRIAFAPEMVEPEGESKRVCHNCGCGC